MADLIRYQIYCQTEAKTKYWFLPRTAPTPTTCPDNSTHVCNLSSVAQVELGTADPRSVDNVPFVQLDLRTGRPNSQSFTVVSHDFSDRTSWYQNSVQVQDLALSTTDNLNYQAPSGQRHWVNINSPKLTVDYKGVLERDGTTTLASLREVVVSVDGQVVDPSTYTINFATGLVTFTQPQSAAVTASFWHNDGVLNPSDFLVNPPPGYMFRIQHLELQFTKTVGFTNAVGYEAWAGGALADYMDFNQQLFEAGYGQSRTKFRNIRDLLNWCNNAYPMVPACGDLTEDVLVFPFLFLVAPQIKSSQGTLIRIYNENDLEITAEIATATFYMELVLESEI